MENVDKKVNSEQEQEQNQKCESRSTSSFLCFVTAIVGLNYLTLGTTVVWISPVASKLSSYDPEENPLGKPITTLELSLVGSLSQTGMVIGPILLEKLFDKFGRKRSINILSLFIIASYLTLAFAKHIYLYYAVIFVIGICIGGNLVGISMYISEVSEGHNRGKLSCYIGSNMPMGNLYGYLLGSNLSIKYFTLFAVVPCIIMVITSELFLPESPQYLVNKGKKEEALSVLQKLLGSEKSRLDIIVKELELNKNKPQNKSHIKQIFENRSSRNGVLICSFLSSLPVFCGLPAIMSYLQSIFESAGTVISPSLCTIIVGSLQIVCYLLASYLVEKLGRRPLLLCSSILTTIPLSILVAYFCLTGTEIIIHLRWVPIMGILLLVTCAVTGMCAVPSAYMNEVFMSDVKSTALSFVYFVSSISIAILIFVFPLLFEYVGLAWTFWIFDMLCIIAFAVVYFKVPETKGQSILKIQDLLAK